MASFADYEREVLAGFQDHERKRMDRARKAYEFFRGDFSRYSPRVRTGIYQPSRYQRTSLLMQRIVEALTKHLYGRGPARSIPDAEAASEWLDAQYAREGVDALMQEADRLACVGDVCAVQVAATGDPDRPVKFFLWPAHQLVVWEAEDDPTRPDAVATIDFYDQRRRLRLWTAEEFRTYETNRGDDTAGGTAFYPAGPAEDNYFGVLPFAFVHFNPPNCEFWSGGPGDHLTEANDYINFFLTEMGDSIRYCAKPILKAFGIRDGWTPPQGSEPGDVWTPPAAYTDASGNGIPPELGFLQPDLTFISEAWADAQSYIDHTLQCNNCPPAEIRMEQGAAASGVAIVMEQLPLVIRAQGRQRAFVRYERDLARVCLAVGAAELGQLDRPDASLDPSLAEELALRWPSMLPDVPGATEAQDKADLEALETGQTSRIQIAMRKFNMTREQAVQHLKDVADDLAEESRLGLPPIPTLPAKGTAPVDGGGEKPESPADGE
jgi:hypothetical protein